MNLTRLLEKLKRLDFYHLGARNASMLSEPRVFAPFWVYFSGEKAQCGWTEITALGARLFCIRPTTSVES
jgi:hypothetical protein